MISILPAVFSLTSLAKAKARVAAAKKSEADMLDRAPPQSDQAFANPKQAFDEAMRIVRRQAKLKNPKLSGSEIFKLRDALNFFAEKLDRRRERHSGGPVHGIAVDAGAYGGKGDAAAIVLGGQLEAAAVGTGQQVGLAAIAGQGRAQLIEAHLVVGGYQDR